MSASWRTRLGIAYGRSAIKACAHAPLVPEKMDNQRWIFGRRVQEYCVSDSCTKIRGKGDGELTARRAALGARYAQPPAQALALGGTSDGARRGADGGARSPRFWPTPRKRARAVCLDGGMEPALALTRRLFDDDEAAGRAARAGRQGRAQPARRRRLGCRRTADRRVRPPHEKRFTVEVWIRGRPPRAGGDSKKAAEQAAAASALEVSGSLKHQQEYGSDVRMRLANRDIVINPLPSVRRSSFPRTLRGS